MDLPPPSKDMSIKTSAPAVSKHVSLSTTAHAHEDALDSFGFGMKTKQKIGIQVDNRVNKETDYFQSTFL